MQEAFSAALTSWPEKGIPQNPAGWITAAAHRKVIDQSRREKTRQDKQDSLRYETKIFAYSNNHAVAVPMSEGLEQGLILIDQLGDIDELKSYYLYHAARADILRRMCRQDEALQEYERTLALTTNAVEQRYLRRRIAELTSSARRSNF